MDRERLKDLAQQRAIGAGNPGTWSRTEALRGLTGGVYWWRLCLILHRVSGAEASGCGMYRSPGYCPRHLSFVAFLVWKFSFSPPLWPTAGQTEQKGLV